MIVFLIGVVLLAMLTLGAYVDRVYTELGKFLAREYQDNVDSWLELIEPRFGLGRDSISLCATVLRLTAVIALSLVFGRLAIRPTGVLSMLQGLLELTLTVLIFDRLLPQILFARTQGLWVSRIRWIFKGLLYLVLPIALLLSLLLSIVSLAEQEVPRTEETSEEDVDALLEAGEEEGILEGTDRALVRSVVEFGDLTVREVMTPRPEIFAVPDDTTLADFTEQINRSVFSRVPVYSGTLDTITGIAFAHDLLQVRDEDAGHRTLREIKREAVFTPEPKKVNELLREMQSQKQHMRIVIDEYGAVAGLVTIEDVIEAIVGNIEDERDSAAAHEAVQRESEDSFIVPGNLDVADLRDLFAAESADENDAERSRLHLRGDLEATTVGGLVSELAGHIPEPGEVVESDGLRMEVIASTTRLVTRVRVQLTALQEET